MNIKAELEDIFGASEQQFSLSDFFDAIEEIVPVLKGEKGIIKNRKSLALIQLLNKLGLSNLKKVEYIVCEYEDERNLSLFFVNYSKEEIVEKMINPDFIFSTTHLFYKYHIVSDEISNILEIEPFWMI